jgi:arginyl-tRNA synthetase
VYSGESIAAKRAADVFTQLRERELLVSSNGAQIVELEESYKIPNALLQKSDGTTLYLTRDIAAAQMRHEEFGPFDKMYYVAGAEQVLHFQQFFKIIELLGLPWAKKCVHVPFGKVRGMSTRLGKAVFLEDIMDIARDCMVEIIKNNPDKMAELDDPIKVAEQIGFSVLVVRDFSARRNKDYDFSWPAPDDAFGDTGAYIQYNHARLAG